MNLDLAVRELAAYVRPGPGPTGDPAVGWPALLALADEHRLLPALWSALAGRGVRPLPAALAEAAEAAGAPAPLAVLHAAHEANRRRVADLRAHLDAVVGTLRAAGIDAVPLKGAHYLAAGWLPDPAARVAVDVDVLVPAEAAHDAEAALVAVGYARAGAPATGADPADHQLPALAHPDRAGSVELHVEPLTRFHRAVLRGAEVLADATATGPSDTHAMVVLLAHAQLQDDGALLLRLPLRALWDLAVLDGRIRPDWQAVADHLAAGGRWARVGLAGMAVTARELFDVDLDRHVPTAGGAAWLRAVGWASRHPGAADAYRRAAYLPRALRRDRMADLYGARGGLPLLGARARHVARGLADALGRRDRP